MYSSAHSFEMVKSHHSWEPFEEPFVETAEKDVSSDEQIIEDATTHSTTPPLPSSTTPPLPSTTTPSSSTAPSSTTSASTPPIDALSQTLQEVSDSVSPFLPLMGTVLTGVLEEISKPKDASQVSGVLHSFMSREDIQDLMQAGEAISRGLGVNVSEEVEDVSKKAEGVSENGLNESKKRKDVSNTEEEESSPPITEEEPDVTMEEVQEPSTPPETCLTTTMAGLMAGWIHDSLVKHIPEKPTPHFPLLGFPQLVREVCKLLRVQANVEALQRVMSEPNLVPLIQALAQWECNEKARFVEHVAPHAQILFSMLNDLFSAIPGLHQLLLPVVTMLMERFKGDSVADSEEKHAHRGIVCDGCDMSPIRGIRYKSAIVVNFDLCAQCEESQVWEKTHAPFLKVRTQDKAPAELVCVLKGQGERRSNWGWRAGEGNTSTHHQVRNNNHHHGTQYPHYNKPNASSNTWMRRRRKMKAGENRVGTTTVVGTPVVHPTSPSPACPGKHALVRFKAFHAQFECDVCGSSVPVGTPLVGCRSCDWDSCASHDLVVSKGSSLQPSRGTTQVSSGSSSSPPAKPQAKFVRDLNWADGSVVLEQQSIHKTWVLRNTGQAAWPRGTRLMHVGGDQLGFPLRGVEVESAPAGTTVEVTVELTMPSITPSTSNVHGYFRLVAPSSDQSMSRFGHRFWVSLKMQKAPVLLPSKVVVPLPQEFTLKYQPQLRALNEMGFQDDPLSVELLDRFHGEVDSVVRHLLWDK